MKCIHILVLILVAVVPFQSYAETGYAMVDGDSLAYDEEDRLYMIACIMSEINEFTYDSTNIYEKSVAMSYVILRRARLGSFDGGNGIEENVLAENQFYGMVLHNSSHDCDLSGRHWPHSVLARLSIPYWTEVLVPQFETYPDSRFLKAIRYLIPPDQLGSWDDNPLDARRRSRLNSFRFLTRICA